MFYTIVYSKYGGAHLQNPVVTVPEILLPKDADLSKWAVIACDQYTSQPEYWEELKTSVGRQPSTLRMVLPEVYLDEPDYDNRVKNIHRTMKNYLSRDMFETHKGFVYVRREVAGRVRHGLVIAVDLEQYDYAPDSTSKIRATEETIVERIPARVEIRRKAVLDIPHIMLLIDDKTSTVFGLLKKNYKQLEKLYDFKLYGGERIEGYLVNETDAVISAFENLLKSRKHGIMFAMGDGNHSLAAAKALYEEQKAKGEDVSRLRYALAEVVNIYDPALAFESINRVLFGMPEYGLTRIRELINQYPGASAEIQTFSKREYMEEEYAKTPGLIRMCTQHGYMTMDIHGVDDTLAPLQRALDVFLRECNAKIDYVHGDDVAFDLGAKPGNMCFVLAPFDKSELFKRIKNGPLPRKAFSMGGAESKRYYLECKKLTD